MFYSRIQPILLYREGWCETREVFYKRRWEMDALSLR